MLMEGIKILNQTEIVKPNVIFPILGVVLIFISAIICSKLFLKKDGNQFYLGLFTGIMIIIILVSTFFSMRYAVPTGKYKYEVTVDDNITYKNYKKFRDKYEIIKEKENSLIVEEKGES